MSKASIEAGRGHVSLSTDDSKLRAGLAAAQSHMQAWGRATVAIGAGISAAGVGIISPFLAATAVFSNMASDMLDMSQRTGVSVEALSELAYVALQSGAGIDELEVAIKKMQKTLVDASEGSAGATKALDSLGLTIANFRGLRVEEQFELIAERISQIDNPAQRTAAALEILGKSGTKMLPMMMDGAAGIRRLREEAQRLGITMSTADANAGEAMGDQFSLLKRLGQMVGFNLGAAIAPTVAQFLGYVIEALGAVNLFVKENRGLFLMLFTVGSALVVAGTAVMALGVSISTLSYGFTIIGGAISAVTGLLGLLWSATTFAASGFGVLKVASMAWSAATVAASVISAGAIGIYNAAMVTAHFLTWGLKVGLIALGVTAALVGIAINAALIGIFIAPLVFLGYFVSKWVMASDFIKKQWEAFTTALKMQWEAIKSVAGPVIEYLGQLFAAMGEVAMDYLRPIIGWFTGTLFPMIGRIAGYFSGAFSTTASNFMTMASGLVGTATQAWGGIMDAFAISDMTAVWQIIQATAILAWAQIVAFIEPTWNVWKDAFTDTFAEVWTLLRSMFESGWAFVTAGFWDLAANIIDALGPVISTVRSLLEALSVIDPTGAAGAALNAINSIPLAGDARSRAGTIRGTADAERMRREREDTANWFDEQAARVARDMAAESGNAAAIAEAQAILDTLTNNAWQERAMQDYIRENFADLPAGPGGDLGAGKITSAGSFSAQATFGLLGASSRQVGPMERLVDIQRAALESHNRANRELLEAQRQAHQLLRAIERAAGAVFA